jgi:hypothetical protein
LAIVFIRWVSGKEKSIKYAAQCSQCETHNETHTFNVKHLCRRRTFLAVLAKMKNIDWLSEA